MFVKTTLGVLLLTAILCSTSPAFAEKGGKSHGQNKEKNHDHDKKKKHKGDKNKQHSAHQNGNTVIVIPYSERLVIKEYMAEEYHSKCPPGLAKKHNGCLPPGQAKKRYIIGQALPSDVILFRFQRSF